MTTTSFLARKTLGQPRYLLVAMACVFALALIPSGVKRALNSSSSAPEHWLPKQFAEVQDLAWFSDHFRGEQFAMVSWDGCTLGDSERIELFAKKLVPTDAATAPERFRMRNGAGAPAYARVTSGPQVIRQLMQGHAGMTYTGAIKRIEGALVGPVQRDAMGRTLGNESRATCLVVELSPEALASDHATHAAIDALPRIAAECGIDAAAVHMGGAPVDNTVIAAEGRRTLLSLAAIVGLGGAGLCYWRLRSVRLTVIVIAVAGASAGLSLAVVSYMGAFEVMALGRATPAWGGLDAVLMVMPAIVYLIAISAALHLLNYYRHAQRDPGLARAAAAAENAAAMGWRPAAIAAIATAAGLATLATTDLVPLQKFGVFTALSVGGMIFLLFGIATVLLHRYPIVANAASDRSAARAQRATNGAFSGLSRFAAEHYGVTLVACTLMVGLLVAGMTRLDAQVQILKLLDRKSDLARDYAWFETHIGNVVPMEVVLTMPAERLRSADEHAELDGQQYRLTMLERLELLRQIARRLEAFPQIGRAMSAANFAPMSTETGLTGADRRGDYGKNKLLENHRDQLLAGDYLRMEHAFGDQRPSGRELWRLNARVAAMSDEGAAVDYGTLLGQVKQAVEPVLWSYQQRDMIVRALHEQGKKLAGARVCVLFRAPNRAEAPPAEVQERVLAELLKSSGIAIRDFSYYNLAVFERPGQGDAPRDESFRKRALASLKLQDAVILASASRDPVAAQIVQGGVYVVDVTDLPHAAESVGRPLIDDGGPRPIRAVYTGIAPVVNRAQRQLLGNLNYALWCAAGAVAVVITLGYMSIPAGALAVVPSLLPLATVFGLMGWLGLKIDLGVTMTAALALGVAVEGVVHFINWFQRGMSAGMDRRTAVECAYDNCGTAMFETAAIAGLGLSALAFSPFTPLREVAYLMAATMAASLAVNLVLLPAMLASPLGWFFAPAAMRRLDPLGPKLQAAYAHWRGAPVVDDAELLPLAQAPKAPHFGDVPAPSPNPAPSRRTILAVNAEERREIAEGPHAALHAKLQGLRRPRTGDSPAL